MFPIESVTVGHALIGINVASCVKARLAKSGCRIAGSPLRVRVSPSKYVVPDFLIFCGKPELTDEFHDTIVNPKVIIEILSPSTMNYDSAEKFRMYRSLSSFEEYILIFQDRPRIQTFRKTADNRWALSTFDGLESVAAIESLGFAMPLAEVYDGIEEHVTERKHLEY
jgi:Uma2 family endonuclease